MHNNYSRKLVLESTHTDFLSKWRISSIFSFAQELAGESAAKLGNDRIWMRENNKFWAIVRANLVVHKYPNILDTVDCKTWAGVPKSTLCPRYFEFFVDNILVAEMSTIWMLIDLKSRRVLKPQEAQINLPETARDCNIEEPTKISLSREMLEKTELAETRICRYSDVDLNGHMNNAKYIDWIFDTFDFAKHKDCEIAEMQINFSSEVAPETALELHKYAESSNINSDINSDFFIINGISKKLEKSPKTHFIAKGIWRKI